MAEHHYQTTDDGGRKTHFSHKGPSSSQILAVVTLFPIGAILLFLAGITLTGTVVGLAITTPLFVIFSPVIVPAGLVICLAVTGFLTSGVFGITALSSISWIVKYVREMQSTMQVPEQLEYAKKRAKETVGHLGQKTREGAQEAVGYVGQKTKDVGQKAKETGQMVQSKAQEGGKTQAAPA